MALNFQELDYRPTPLGELILRRRKALSLEDTIVYEVILDGDFLMSSLVNDSEIALAEIGLKDLASAEGESGLDVVVGGLGLGYTAKAALDDPRVNSVLVVEYLAPIIDWHRRGLVPLGEGLSSDPRCQFLNGDFFAMAIDPAPGFNPHEPEQRYHAILVDIDHSPSSLLHPSHAAFYEPEGLRRLVDYLRPGGVFALWSADPPEDSVTDVLRTAFESVEAHAVKFHNPLLSPDDVSTVYGAQRS
ncbi:MAG: spermidine synthase family protein [Planctomycetota bacterium]|jgi:spermidine synthase